VHKTVNVLDKLLKQVHPQAKSMIHQICQACTRESAEKAFDRFLANFGDKCAKATESRASDQDLLLGF